MTVFFVLPTSPISSYLHPQSVRQGRKTKQRTLLLTISVFTVMLCLGSYYIYYPICNVRYCASWAYLSECSKNPSWMLPHCPIACGLCTLCEDFNLYCEVGTGTGTVKMLYRRCFPRTGLVGESARQTENT